MAILAYDDVMLREPRLLVPQQKPLGPSVLDPAHPAFPYLKAAVFFLPAEKAGNDQKNYLQFTSSLNVTAAKTYVTFPGGTGDAYFQFLGDIIPTNSSITLLVRFRKTGSVADNTDRDIFHSDGTTGSDNAWSVRVYNQRLRLVYRNAADNAIHALDTNPATYISLNTWYTAAISHTYGAGTLAKMYANGVEWVAAWAAGNGNDQPYTGTQNVRIGGITSSNPLDGDIEFCCAFVPRLPNAIAQALTADPYSLLIPA